MSAQDEENALAVALLQRISQGEQQALEDFYRLFESRVYHFALAKLNEPADAADTVNEVMMEVWKHGHRFENRSKVSTWLLGITHHKIVDRLRKRQRMKQQEDIDDHRYHLDDDSAPMEQVIHTAQNARLLQDCLDKLSGNHREVLHLAFFEDLAYQDIARIVSCPEGTVKTRVHHAKNALKKCLASFKDALEPVI